MSDKINIELDMTKDRDMNAWCLSLDYREYKDGVQSQRDIIKNLSHHFPELLIMPWWEFALLVSFVSCFTIILWRLL